MGFFSQFLLMIVFFLMALCFSLLLLVFYPFYFLANRFFPRWFSWVYCGVCGKRLVSINQGDSDDYICRECEYEARF